MRLDLGTDAISSPYDRLTTADVLEAKREFHMPTSVNTKITTGKASVAL